MQRHNGFKNTLCIFTPTYNRAYCLIRLFESLKVQSSQDFYWLVVDDGSTDETRELVQSFKNQSPSFSIEYVFQENGGKQRAHNAAVKICESELFFCVDSDDVLVPGAVQTILETWKYEGEKKSVAGAVALCGRDAETPLAKRMPQGFDYLTLWDLYYKLGHKGDVALVYRTQVLKNTPFVLAEGEKFMAETYVYHQIDRAYQLRVIDSVLLIREYLPDGYTANVRRITKENPKNYRDLKRMFIGYSDTLPLKFQHTVLYLVGCILSDTPHCIKNAPSMFLAMAAYPFAWLLCKTIYR